MNRTSILLCILLALFARNAFADFAVGPFGPFGQGGELNGQTLTFGTSGSVVELDGYLNVAGQDLNGTDAGTSRPLSEGLPRSIALAFDWSLSTDHSDLTLTYRFTNTSQNPLLGFQFLFFVDADINSSASNADEFGETIGTLGQGSGDSHPDSWEIDEPQFVFGNIVENLFSGTLDNTNSLPVSSPENTSFALGFQLGTLNPNDVATVKILLSDDGFTIGTFAVKHLDQAVPANSLTLSGQATVGSIPEPISMIPLATGLIALGGYTWNRRRSIR